jgi:hypothetical protein
VTAQEPSLAERARTVLDGVSAGTLVTAGCRGSRTVTVVSVRVEDEGDTDLWLEDDSPIARLLGDGRVVSLLLPAFATFRSLQLTGPVTQRRCERPGLRRYRMSPLSVRLFGPTSLAIPVREFAAARPDPLSPAAATLMRHLEQAHACELLACVHAHGHHDALAAVPQELDRYGITVGALCLDGVRSIRLPFPDGPVTRLEELRPALRVPLTCRCHRRPA